MEQRAELGDGLSGDTAGGPRGVFVLGFLGALRLLALLAADSQRETRFDGIPLQPLHFRRHLRPDAFVAAEQLPGTLVRILLDPKVLARRHIEPEFLRVGFVELLHLVVGAEFGREPLVQRERDFANGAGLLVLAGLLGCDDHALGVEPRNRGLLARALHVRLGLEPFALGFVNGRGLALGFLLRFFVAAVEGFLQPRAQVLETLLRELLLVHVQTVHAVRIQQHDLRCRSHGVADEEFNELGL